MNFAQLDLFLKKALMCPLCHAERHSGANPHKPCRFCGCKLIPIMDYLCDKMIEDALEIRPLYTGSLRRSIIFPIGYEVKG